MKLFLGCRGQKESSRDRVGRNSTFYLRPGEMGGGQAEDILAGSADAYGCFRHQKQHRRDMNLPEPSSEGLGIMQRIATVNCEKKTVEAKRKEAATKIKQTENKLKHRMWQRS